MPSLQNVNKQAYEKLSTVYKKALRQMDPLIPAEDLAAMRTAAKDEIRLNLDLVRIDEELESRELDSGNPAMKRPPQILDNTESPKAHEIVRGETIRGLIDAFTL